MTRDSSSRLRVSALKRLNPFAGVWRHSKDPALVHARWCGHSARAFPTWRGKSACLSPKIIQLFLNGAPNSWPPFFRFGGYLSPALPEFLASALGRAAFSIPCASCPPFFESRFEIATQAARHCARTRVDSPHHYFFFDLGKLQFPNDLRQFFSCPAPAAGRLSPAVSAADVRSFEAASSSRPILASAYFFLWRSVRRRSEAGFSASSKAFCRWPSRPAPRFPVFIERRRRRSAASRIRIFPRSEVLPARPPQKAPSSFRRLLGFGFFRFPRS